MFDSSSPLAELLSEPRRSEFFQAVRLLSLYAAELNHSDSEAHYQPLGEDGPADKEIVRFAAQVALHFPGSEITAVHREDVDDAMGDQFRMAVSFMGLTGPSGILPQHYTRLLIERTRARDLGLRDFLDMFHHRSISLFYRAWEKYRVPIAYEKKKRIAPEQRRVDVVDCLKSLVGIGTPGLAERLELSDDILVYYSGFLAAQNRNANSLAAMISDYFDLPTRIQQFRGKWLYLPTSVQTCLLSGEGGHGNNVLGATALAGDRAWCVENDFRVQVGPLSYNDFCRFMPSGDMLSAICQLIRFYVGVEYEFDINPVLAKEDVPACSLGGDKPARLGWDTWLHTSPPMADLDDAVFSKDVLHLAG